MFVLHTALGDFKNQIVCAVKLFGPTNTFDQILRITNQDEVALIQVLEGQPGKALSFDSHPARSLCPGSAPECSP